LSITLAITCLILSVSANESLLIDRAYCGAEGSWRDIKGFLESKLKSGSLDVSLSQPFEQIGGDPAWGQVKHLLIDYHASGKPFRLLLKEEYPVAFAITLPSSEALPPGADPRASAILAEISGTPVLETKAPHQDPEHQMHYFAFYISILTLICACAALIQLRQIKKQLRARAVTAPHDSQTGL